MNRRKFLGAAPAGLLAALAWDITPSAAQGPVQMTAQPLPDTNEGRIAELVDGNHILADQGVVDGFGHISFRSATNSKHYWMARSVAPNSVVADDIMEFDENSQPIDLRGRQLYGERFIHGEIYRARPDVYSVIHCHTPEVLPFTVTKTPLKALVHTAFFLGSEPAPVFDMARDVGPENHMLIYDTKTGSAVARVLGKRSVVLMRGHGMAVAAPSIRDAVFRAIYTKEDAQVELEALKLGNPMFMSPYETTRFDPGARNWEEWLAQAKAKRGGH